MRSEFCHQGYSLNYQTAILVIMPRTFEYFRWIVKQRGIWISHHTQRHSMTVKYLKEPLNFVND